MPRILVTGGCGYIGSHTMVDLLENGYDVVSIDNLSRSDGSSLKGIEQITGKRVVNHKIDLCNKQALDDFFRLDHRFDGVVHFAAFKAVGESVEKPLVYFTNNVVSHINLLECVTRYKIPSFIFSSSCSVYGDIDKMPVSEATPVNAAASPYGRTKQMCEEILFDTAPSTDTGFVSLRYFNPVGAHPTGLIGEKSTEKPNNLVPCITQSALGLMPQVVVHGDDYPTRDGTCIRDYVHVMDLARAHRLAFEKIQKGRRKVEVVNIGTGNGVSVLEMVKTFEKTTGQKLNYRIGPRRAGDVVTIYSDTTKANKLLDWKPKYTVEDMMETAWKWEQHYRRQGVAK